MIWRVCTSYGADCEPGLATRCEIPTVTSWPARSAGCLLHYPLVACCIISIVVRGRDGPPPFRFVWNFVQRVGSSADPDAELDVPAALKGHVAGFYSRASGRLLNALRDLHQERGICTRGRTSCSQRCAWAGGTWSPGRLPGRGGGRSAARRAPLAARERDDLQLAPRHRVQAGEQALPRPRVRTKSALGAGRAVAFRRCVHRTSRAAAVEERAAGRSAVPLHQEQPPPSDSFAVELSEHGAAAHPTALAGEDAIRRQCAQYDIRRGGAERVRNRFGRCHA